MFHDHMLNLLSLLLFLFVILKHIWEIIFRYLRTHMLPVPIDSIWPIWYGIGSVSNHSYLGGSDYQDTSYPWGCLFISFCSFFLDFCISPEGCVSGILLYCHSLVGSSEIVFLSNNSIIHSFTCSKSIQICTKPFQPF